jgi:hypothetical protein
MATALVFQIFNFRPGGTFRLFIHGYGDREGVNYSLVVHPQLLEGVAGGGVLISRVESFRHVDGTQARLVSIENPSSGWQDVDVLESVESF